MPSTSAIASSPIGSPGRPAVRCNSMAGPVPAAVKSSPSAAAFSSPRGAARSRRPAAARGPPRALAALLRRRTARRARHPQPSSRRRRRGARSRDILPRYGGERWRRTLNRFPGRSSPRIPSHDARRVVRIEGHSVRLASCGSWRCRQRCGSRRRIGDAPQRCRHERVACHPRTTAARELSNPPAWPGKSPWRLAAPR